MDSHLKKLQEALSEATDGMSAEERSWHPPGKWCADQVLEHLYLTYTGTIRGFTRALEAGKPPATRATFRQRARNLLVLGLGYMPEGRKAPAGVVPRGLGGVGRRLARGSRRWMRLSGGVSASWAAGNFAGGRFWSIQFWGR